MDVFGEKWTDHVEKLKTGFSDLQEEDVCVLCGDLSWGMDLQDSLEDFRFIDSLPGRKIVLKGNHDYWWTTLRKMTAFFEQNGIRSIEILRNNSFEYNGIAICGTRGWFYEEETGSDHDRKILLREVSRLKASLDAGGEREKIVFLHYPPIFQNYRCEEILQMLREYGVRSCYYGHLHGKGCAAAFRGWADGTEYHLISADAVDFHPVKIRD